MRAIALTLSSALLFVGCPTDGAGGPGGLGDPGGVIANGDDVPDRDPDEVWSADLSDGELIELDWATGSFGCWPGTESVNFSGSHVLFERPLPADNDAWVRATPDADIDVSLYVIKAGLNTVGLPPDLSTSLSCDASYDRAGNSNVGVSEATKVLGNNDYRLLIGVAGANDTMSGGFDVEFWLGE